MSWDLIRSTAQFLGSTALVISLIYLAIQIRFARLAAADTSRAARAAGVREIDLTMVNSAELRKNWLAASDLTSVYEELGAEMNVDVEAALQVDTVCQCWMRLHWGHYKSITTPDDLEDLERLVSVFYSVPPMVHSWERSPYGKAAYDADFVQFVDNAVTKRANLS